MILINFDYQLSMDGLNICISYNLYVSHLIDNDMNGASVNYNCQFNNIVDRDLKKSRFFKQKTKSYAHELYKWTFTILDHDDHDQ